MERQDENESIVRLATNWSRSSGRTKDVAFSCARTTSDSFFQHEELFMADWLTADRSATTSVPLPTVYRHVQRPRCRRRLFIVPGDKVPSDRHPSIVMKTVTALTAFLLIATATTIEGKNLRQNGGIEVALDAAGRFQDKNSVAFVPRGVLRR
ncbi:unnamed protein product [Aphanomyces euteiches]|nr:hypothetical protein Ae201684P_016077 [Aphanomyces euteiches]